MNKYITNKQEKITHLKKLKMHFLGFSISLPTGHPSKKLMDLKKE